MPKILFVEDSRLFKKSIASSLAGEGFDVITASTGEDAVKSAQKESPELIVLDMKLPRLDGMMVLRILRGGEQTRNIPVIVYSADLNERDKTAAEKLGVVEYFKKDVAPLHALVASIRSNLGTAA